MYPITRKVKSEYSGHLEITWHNGKKYLNTKNANYSYGSLQAILKFGLKKIDLKNVCSVLLLGLGGGSVIETLRDDFKYTKSITAVDIDPVIINLAKKEFNHQLDQNLSIICSDAIDYIKQNSELFDLIIIDLFIDIEVPDQFLHLSFWKNIMASKSTNGAIIFNASLQKTKSDGLKDVISFLKSHMYTADVYEKVNDTNTIIIAKNL
ncbi:spermine/spermidine synthase [Ichthyenterobacterium magnum]|uniref:Spermine/spermidine synthase n=2 Tax=Ichthyenterobacterium magnum TaxID=1230530 RepID=A0A420DXN8_9FLAO|nr:spermine/spermidine synthase [Ichthyenterobacterium magnum]